MSDDETLEQPQPQWKKVDRFPIFEELLNRLEGVRDELEKEKERLEKLQEGLTEEE